MPEFAYTARTANGRDITGLISAETKRDVLAMLTERALFPMSVEPAGGSKFSWTLQRPIKTEVLAGTLTQLSDLLENGVPLMRALEVLSEQATHPRMQAVLDQIRSRVADGQQLNDAMAAHPDVFNELSISIIRAGTEGAFLEQSLRQTAEFLERQEELRSRIRSAMAYPAFLAVAGGIVTLVLIVFFVPKFAELFKQLEEAGTLPGATVALLWLSDTLGRFGVLIAAALAGAVYGIRRWARTTNGRRLVDRWKIRLPVFGPIFLNGAVSRFCRILGTLMRNGVPLLKSLEISSESSGNVVLGTAIRESAENVSSGESLSTPLANCGLFPSNVMAMIAVAEESNNLEVVLNNVADVIDRKISRQLDTMVRMIEPALLMVMGSAVLFVIVALLLPVFEMSTTMG
ncbi:MAG: type II secretion system F family protein [Planctomycetaceae bacterium]|nr:type II secretion system F family protein [Planctomycetaceae bacterium]